MENNEQQTGGFCPKCGKQTVQFQREVSPIDNQYHTVGFCQSCGHTWQTDAAAQSVQPSVVVQQVQPKKKDHTAAKVVFITLGAVLVLGIIGNMGKNNSKTTTGTTEVTAATAENGNAGNATPTAETTTSAAETKPEMSYEITDTSFNYYTNSIGSVEFYGIVEVTNTGSKNIYLKDCTFDLEDNDGHLLQTESLFVSSCPDIIAPGEKGYFYNGIGANLLDKGVSTDNGLKLVPHYKLVEATGEIINYDVTDTELRKDNFGGAKVTGRLTNNTDKDVSLFYVNVVFKDASGKALYITGTNVMDLTAGATVSFEVSSAGANDSVNFDDIADYEVVARKDYYQF